MRVRLPDVVARNRGLVARFDGMSPVLVSGFGISGSSSRMSVFAQALVSESCFGDCLSGGASSGMSGDRRQKLVTT